MSSLADAGDQPAYRGIVAVPTRLREVGWRVVLHLQEWCGKEADVRKEEGE